MEWAQTVVEAEHVAPRRRTVGSEAGFVARDEGAALAAGRVGPRALKAWYSARYLAHAPLGLVNCTVQVRDEQVEPWVPTQMHRMARESAARGMSLAVDSVQVVVLAGWRAWSAAGGGLRGTGGAGRHDRRWLKSSSYSRVSRPPGTMTIMVRTHATFGALRQATSLGIK